MDVKNCISIVKKLIFIAIFSYVGCGVIVNCLMYSLSRMLESQFTFVFFPFTLLNGGLTWFSKQPTYTLRESGALSLDMGTHSMFLKYYQDQSQWANYAISIPRGVLGLVEVSLAISRGDFYKLPDMLAKTGPSILFVLFLALAGFYLSHKLLFPMWGVIVKRLSELSKCDDSKEKVMTDDDNRTAETSRESSLRVSRSPRSSDEDYMEERRRLDDRSRDQDSRDSTVYRAIAYMNKKHLDKYNSFKHLESGAFGKVFRARDKLTGESCAIKVISKGNVQDTAIEAEIKALKISIDGPFVVTIQTVFECEKFYYLVMELCKQDLFHLIYYDRNMRMTEEAGIVIAAQLVVALQFLHSRHILHRDIKPSNILINGQMQVRVTDFGSAMVDWNGKKGLWGTNIGTTMFLAPEVSMNFPYNDGCDWWGVGLVTYEVLHRAFPFDGDTNDELVYQACYSRVHYPHIGLSPSARQFMSMMLKKDPDHRLGCSTCDRGNIKMHPFFDGILWHHLEQGHYPEPRAIFRPTTIRKAEILRRRKLQNLEVPQSQIEPPKEKLRSKNKRVKAFNQRIMIEKCHKTDDETLDSESQCISNTAFGRSTSPIPKPEARRKKYADHKMTSRMMEDGDISSSETCSTVGTISWENLEALFTDLAKPSGICDDLKRFLRYGPAGCRSTRRQQLTTTDFSEKTKAPEKAKRRRASPETSRKGPPVFSFEKKVPFKTSTSETYADLFPEVQNTFQVLPVYQNSSSHLSEGLPTSSLIGAIANSTIDGCQNSLGIVVENGCTQRHLLVTGISNLAGAVHMAQGAHIRVTPVPKIATRCLREPHDQSLANATLGCTSELRAIQNLCNSTNSEAYPPNTTPQDLFTSFEDQKPVLLWNAKDETQSYDGYSTVYVASRKSEAEVMVPLRVEDNQMFKMELGARKAISSPSVTPFHKKEAPADLTGSISAVSVRGERAAALFYKIENDDLKVRHSSGPKSQSCWYPTRMSETGLGLPGKKQIDKPIVDFSHKLGKHPFTNYGSTHHIDNKTGSYNYESHQPQVCRHAVQEKHNQRAQAFVNQMQDTRKQRPKEFMNSVQDTPNQMPQIFPEVMQDIPNQRSPMFMKAMQDMPNQRSQEIMQEIPNERSVDYLKTMEYNQLPQRIMDVIEDISNQKSQFKNDMQDIANQKSLMYMKAMPNIPNQRKQEALQDIPNERSLARMKTMQHTPNQLAHMYMENIPNQKSQFVNAMQDIPNQKSSMFTKDIHNNQMFMKAMPDTPSQRTNEVMQNEGSLAHMKAMQNTPKQLPQVYMEVMNEIPNQKFQVRDNTMQDMPNQMYMEIVGDNGNIPEENSEEELEEIPYIPNQIPDLSMKGMQDIPNQKFQMFTGDMQYIPNQKSQMLTGNMPYIPNQKSQMLTGDMPYIPNQKSQMLTGDMPYIPNQKSQMLTGDMPYIPNQKSQMLTGDMPYIPNQKSQMFTGDTPYIPKKSPQVFTENMHDIPNQQFLMYTEEMQEIPNQRPRVYMNAMKDTPTEKPGIMMNSIQDMPNQKSPSFTNVMQSTPKLSPQNFTDDFGKRFNEQKSNSKTGVKSNLKQPSKVDWETMKSKYQNIRTDQLLPRKAIINNVGKKTNPAKEYMLPTVQEMEDSFVSTGHTGNFRDHSPNRQKENVNKDFAHEMIIGHFMPDEVQRCDMRTPDRECITGMQFENYREQTHFEDESVKGEDYWDSYEKDFASVPEKKLPRKKVKAHFDQKQVRTNNCKNSLGEKSIEGSEYNGRSGQESAKGHMLKSHSEQVANRETLTTNNQSPRVTGMGNLMVNDRTENRREQGPKRDIHTTSNQSPRVTGMGNLMVNDRTENRREQGPKRDIHTTSNQSPRVTGMGNLMANNRTENRREQGPKRDQSPRVTGMGNFMANNRTEGGKKKTNSQTDGRMQNKVVNDYLQRETLNNKTRKANQKSSYGKDTTTFQRKALKNNRDQEGRKDKIEQTKVAGTPYPSQCRNARDQLRASVVPGKQVPSGESIVHERVLFEPEVGEPEWEALAYDQ